MNSNSKIIEPPLIKDKKLISIPGIESDVCTNQMLRFLAAYRWCFQISGRNLPMLIMVIIYKYLKVPLMQLMFNQADCNIYIDPADNDIVLWIKSFSSKRHKLPNFANVDMEYFICSNCINTEALCLRKFSKHHEKNDHIMYNVNILYSNCQHL